MRSCLALASLVLVACGSAAPVSVDSIAQVEQASVVNSMTLVHRADGNFDVKCAGNTHEIATPWDLFADRICLADHTVRCIPHCTARWANGQCQSYGPDFCGRGPL